MSKEGFSSRSLKFCFFFFVSFFFLTWGIFKRSVTWRLTSNFSYRWHISHTGTQFYYKLWFLKGVIEGILTCSATCIQSPPWGSTTCGPYTVHRWSLYTDSITWKLYFWGPVKCGLYKQLIFIYRWSLRAELTVPSSPRSSLPIPDVTGMDSCQPMKHCNAEAGMFLLNFDWHEGRDFT